MNLLQPRCNRIVFLIFLLAFGYFVPSAQANFVIGRITAIEGELLRFVPAEKDWVATAKDAPFGIEDALYSGQDARAEIIMPNNAWIRLGASTQVQLIAAEPDAVEIDVSSGVARFFNESEQTVIKATTPFGYVVAQPGASFDLYVGDQSVETIALSGTVDFIHVANDAKYQVEPGGNSIIANKDEVGTGDGTVDADWSAWNRTRDDLWAKRAAEPTLSAQYLPPSLQNDAYELDQNGRWERVMIRGEEQEVWQPTEVAPDWAPFTSGRWAEWNGDETWIPDEPFGYMTHHYGNWENINGAWYWIPPPPAETEPAWYPGRVAWVGSDDNVGWVPLAPEEPYYSHHPWGPAAVVVTAAVVTAYTVATLVNLNHSVIVPRDHFYRSNNYRSFRNTHVSRDTIRNNYRSSPVINNKIIKNYNTNPARFAATNQVVNVKPHESAIANIKHIPVGSSGSRQSKFNANSIDQTLKNTRTATPNTQANVKTPQITSKLVPANQANLPTSKVDFKHRNPKTNSVPVSATTTAQGTRPLAPTTSGITTKQPHVTGPGSQITGSRTRRPPLTESNKPSTTAPGATTQQPNAPGPHSLTGPRTPRTLQTESNKPSTTAPGATTQQPNAPGPHSLTGPRTPRTLQTESNKPSTTAPGTTTQQPNVTGPKTLRTEDEPVGTQGSRNLHRPQTESNRPSTTTPGATTQQPGLTRQHTPPPVDQTQQQQEQLKLRQQQQEQQRIHQQQQQQEQLKLRQQQQEQQRIHQQQQQQQEQLKLRQQQQEQQRIHQQQQQHQQQPQQQQQQLHEFCQKNPNDPRCKK